MRIIAGKYRGMRLQSPRDMTTRPVTDRVKESIFSILYTLGMPQGCRVADIFCGTGSFGLEALSRGAEYVSFVELNRKVCGLLNQNIEKARASEQAKIYKADAFKLGAPLFGDERKYDLAFVDPPFPMSYETDERSRLGKLLLLLNEQLVEGGYVLVRTNKRAVLRPEYGNLRVVDRREWGKMAETFLVLDRAVNEREEPKEENTEEAHDC